ncbi:hypothetical protein OS493_012198 [Desmophyllum pertusum]|uniref:Uncharacterized protein n=1 Tax=Desmophyllum pertusum TaxID=174260 RepID=A0A9X0A332_9CNID|nr:hypothetical protein OS493_012198 [Desmophyllum pertusum]
MEYPKILCAAIYVVMLSSVALSAPLMSTTELLIRLDLAPSLANATTEMKNVYPFIASNTNLQDTMLLLGMVHTQTCTKNMQLKNKLSVAYIKLSNFISPLYMAYSYEEIQGPQHNVLTQLLMATSFYLNSTASTLRHEVRN